MDIFALFKKMKPKKKDRFLIVEPGQISAPQFGIQQTCRTGVDHGSFLVNLAQPLPAGTVCQGVSDDEKSIRFELPNGMTQICPAEEGGRVAMISLPRPSGVDAKIPHKKILEWVSCAAGKKDEYRQILNGIHFDGESLVATDGHRLHEARLSDSPGVPAFTFPLTHVPLLMLAGGGAGTWQISEEDGETSWLSFGDGLFVHIPHVSGTYPDYRKVIPALSETKTWEIYGVKELFEVHQMAAKVSKAAVRWEIREDALDVSISTKEIQWSRSVSAQIQGTVPTAGFNPKYIAELSKGRTGDLSVARQDELGPALFDFHTLLGCAKLRAVVMPMRL